MAAKRYQVSAAGDSALPRDRFVNVIYLEDVGTEDLDGNCLDIANAFNTHWYTMASREIEVKAYEVGPAPNFPVGHAKINAGLAPASGLPREVALCLSFYSENNVPRRRGRIFLPACGAGGSAQVRPEAFHANKALALAQALADIGGVDVSWNVHSQTTGDDWPVTHAWVDDEWDTMRSRGLRSTTRWTAATGS